MSEGRSVFVKKMGESSATRHSSLVTCHATRGFTLVEMLIVVAILSVLMAIVFRLGSVGGEDSRRTGTVVKLQKIENCLSGYYAAFGSYPPVKVHGSRDIYMAVDKATGDQDQEQGSNANLNWGQVNAACRAQPFGCEYPGSAEDADILQSWIDEIQERYNNKSDYPEYAKSEELQGLFGNGGTVAGRPVLGGGSGWGEYWNKSADWKVIKLFKFGAMSYLLPRYLFMMGDEEIFEGKKMGTIPAQWSDNNDIPCNPYQGEPFGDWKEVWQLSDTEGKGDSQSHDDLVKLANIPSQAVCARWIPNLEHTCRALRDMTFFGVQVNDPDQTGLGLDDEYPPTVNPHKTPAGDKPYLNASITMYDGWHREFYYYSPAPFQSYVVWSAGPNGKTFPPWMKIDDLSSGKDEAMEWKGDDIMQMSH